MSEGRRHWLERWKNCSDTVPFFFHIYGFQDNLLVMWKNFKKIYIYHNSSSSFANIDEFWFDRSVVLRNIKKPDVLLYIKWKVSEGSYMYTTIRYNVFYLMRNIISYNIPYRFRISYGRKFRDSIYSRSIFRGSIEKRLRPVSKHQWKTTAHIANWRNKKLNMSFLGDGKWESFSWM